MLRGAENWMARKASFFVGRAKHGLATRQDHIDETSRVVRGISDWMGGADLPSGSKFKLSQEMAQRIIDESKNPTAELVAQHVRWLELAANMLDLAEEEWREYTEETIAGAEEMSHRLAVVRNTSFLVAAGLAGAAFAPAAFAAATASGAGTATAAGTAITVGATAGGVTGGALEFTGAVRARASQRRRPRAPGSTGTTWRSEKAKGRGPGPSPVGSEPPEGSSRRRSRLRSASDWSPGACPRRSPSAWPSTPQAGGIVGTASGAIAAALENAGALARGEISLTEYAMRVEKGGAAGGVTGVGVGAASAVFGRRGIAADDDWSAVGKELGATAPTPRTAWNLPGGWRQAKPEAFRLIFGSKTLPDINRPGNVKMTLGHIVEKSTGGTHSLDNLMPQLNAVNVRLSGIYARKPFRLTLPSGEERVITSLNGKPIVGSLREAFETGVFDMAEQRAISNYVTHLVIGENPAFERELAELVRRIPELAELVD